MKFQALLLLFTLNIGTLFCEEAAVMAVDQVQEELNAFLSSYLRENGVATSGTQNGVSLENGDRIAPVRVVVSSAMVGDIATRYKGIGTTESRSKHEMALGSSIKPFVRFDWRNAAPLDNECIPDTLANYYIDCEKAKETALGAYKLLSNLFGRHSMELQDVNFLMNEDGDILCDQVSTYNANIKYVGETPSLIQAFNDTRSERSKAVLALMKTAPIPRKKVIVSGPYCAGKTTLIREMEKMLNIPEAEADVKKLANQTQWAIEIPANKRSLYQDSIPGTVSVYLDGPDKETAVQRAKARGDSSEMIEQNLDQEDLGEEFDYRVPTNLEIAEEIQLLRRIMDGTL